MLKFCWDEMYLMCIFYLVSIFVWLKGEIKEIDYDEI